MILPLLVKVSKFCNLRCSYCYETPELGNRERMSLEDLERMFIHVRDYLASWDGGLHEHRLDLYWHGGEPFVQPISYWEDIIALETKVFGARFAKTIHNDVQSNLTQITEAHLPLLRSHFKLGFSFDVINDLRVNVAGKSTARVVREKVEWLLAEGIQLGGIAVISKSNVKRPKAVADYFLERGLSFRVLNVNEAYHLAQVRAAAIPYDDYLSFLRELYRLPKVRKALAQGIRVNPLFHSHQRLSSLSRARRAEFSDREYAEREWVLAINTNGDVYSVADCYNQDFRYGNIFTQTLEEVLSSKERKRRIQRSRARMRSICSGCSQFRKTCSGVFVSHATPEEYRDYESKQECYQSYRTRMMLDESRQMTTTEPIASAQGA